MSAPMVILWHGDKAATRPYAQGLTLYRNADAPASSCPRLVAALAGCQPADAPTNASTPATSQQAGDAAVDAAFADLSKRAWTLDAAVAGQRYPDR